MELLKRPVILGSIAGVALCLLSIGTFAARNWSNSPATTAQSTGIPFSIVAPDDWKTTVSTDETRDEKGARTYEWVSSPGANGVSVAVKDALKDGKTFDEVAAGFGWTADDVKADVALMKDESGDLYKDFTEQDIAISSDADVVNGAKAVRAMRQCLKPCYVEGGAATTVRYVVDASDRVFVLEVLAGTGPNVAGLLNEADAVARTFKEESK